MGNMGICQSLLQATVNSPSTASVNVGVCANGREVNDRDTILKFMLAAGWAHHAEDDPTLIDSYLIEGAISHSGVRGDYNRTALHFSSYDNRSIILQYILTMHETRQLDIDVQDSGGRTPLHSTVYHDNIQAVKILLDFGADRTIKNTYNYETPLATANSWARSSKVVELLKDYYPSEDDKLDAQLASKQLVDSMFQAKGIQRYNQTEIDLKYMSVEAIKTGDLDLLKQAIPYIDRRLAISLATVAIEKGVHLQILLDSGLWEKCLGEQGFKSDNCLNWRTASGLTVFGLLLVGGAKNHNAMETMVMVGLDAIPYSACEPKPDASVAEHVNTARLLCILRILFHLYLYVDVDSTFELIQTLMLEGLYYPIHHHHHHS